MLARHRETRNAGPVRPSIFHLEADGQLLFGGHFFATALIVFCLAKIIFNLVNLRHFNGPDVGRINRWSVISTIVMILMATALAYDVWMDS